MALRGKKNKDVDCPTLLDFFFERKRNFLAMLI